MENRRIDLRESEPGFRNFQHKQLPVDVLITVCTEYHWLSCCIDLPVRRVWLREEYYFIQWVAWHNDPFSIINLMVALRYWCFDHNLNFKYSSYSLYQTTRCYYVLRFTILCSLSINAMHSISRYNGSWNYGHPVPCNAYDILSFC